MSSTPGLHNESTAPTAHPPIADALMLAPLGRPASPWKEGSVVLRSLDGKLSPYQPGSAQQNTWIDLVFSGPGGGKSVLMNAFNLACVLSPQMGVNSQLPLISIIDIGFSSKGLIDMLRDALPEDRRDEAVDRHEDSRHERQRERDAPRHPPQAPDALLPLCAHPLVRIAGGSAWRNSSRIGRGGRAA